MFSLNMGHFLCLSTGESSNYQAPYHISSIISTPPGLSKFHQEPSPQTVPAGGAARFECQIEGVPSPAITWEKDKMPVPEETR